MKKELIALCKNHFMKAQFLLLLSLFILACGGLSTQQQKTYDKQVEQLADQYAKAVEAYINAGKDVKNWSDRKAVLLEMPEYQDTTSWPFRYARVFTDYINGVEGLYTDMKQVMTKNYEGVEYKSAIQSLKSDVVRLKEIVENIRAHQIHGSGVLKGSYSRIGDQPPTKK